MIMTVDVIFTSVLSRRRKSSSGPAANRIICFNSSPTFPLLCETRRTMDDDSYAPSEVRMRALSDKGGGGYDDMPFPRIEVGG